MNERWRTETRRVLALGAVLLLLLIGWRLARRSDPPEPLDPPRAERAPREIDEEPAPRRRVSDTDEQTSYDLLDDAPPAPEAERAVDAVADPIRLLRDEADTYRRRARYPDHVMPLDRARPDPIVDAHTPTIQREPGRRAGEPVLVVWPAKIAFVHPEVPVVYAGVLDADERPIRGTSMSGTVHGEPPALETIATLELRDDGVAPDVSADDGMFAAAITLPPEHLPELAANLMVRVHAMDPDDETPHEGGTTFLVSVPAGRLTGRFRDELRDGSLVVSAEVEIGRPGRLHLQGALYTMEDEPLVWAQAALEAQQPGTTWMDLSYYGLVFRDRGVPGPYRLGSVTLTTSTAMPGAIGDVLEDVHVTRAYALDDFTSEPFDDPEMLRSAEQIEAEIAAREAAP